MVTILEALENADYNISNNGEIGLMLGKAQLHNSFVLLEKGYDIHAYIEELMSGYDKVENVPEKKPTINL